MTPTDPLPRLGGVRVIVTRPPGQGHRLAERLTALGAQVELAPLLDIAPPEDWSGADRALQRLNEFEWVVFTSANGVRGLFGRLEELDRATFPAGLSVAAVGPATCASLRSYGVGVDLVPPEFNASALAAALRSLVTGRRVLLVLGESSRDTLRAELAGVCDVTVIHVYRQVSTDGRHFLAALTGDWPCYLVATSPNIAGRTVDLLPAAARDHVKAGRLRLVTISGLTSDVFHSAGWPVAAEASSADDAGLVAAILGDARAR